jgi:hypothetical protein
MAPLSVTVEEEEDEGMEGHIKVPRDAPFESGSTARHPGMLQIENPDVVEFLRSPHFW